MRVQMFLDVKIKFIRTLVTASVILSSYAMRSTSGVVTCNSLQDSVVNLSRAQENIIATQNENSSITFKELNLKADKAKHIVNMFATLEQISRSGTTSADEKEKLKKFRIATAEIFRGNKELEANQKDSFSKVDELECEQNGKYVKSETHIHGIIYSKLTKAVVNANQCTNFLQGLCNQNKSACRPLDDKKFREELDKAKTEYSNIKNQLKEFAKTNEEFQDYERLKYISLARMTHRDLRCTDDKSKLLINPYVSSTCNEYEITNEQKTLRDMIGLAQELRNRVVAEDYYSELGLGDIGSFSNNSKELQKLKSKYCSETKYKATCSTLTNQIRDVKEFKEDHRKKLGRWDTVVWNPDTEEMDVKEQHPSQIIKHAFQYAAVRMPGTYIQEWLTNRQFQQNINLVEASFARNIHAYNLFNNSLAQCYESSDVWCNPYAGSYSSIFYGNSGGGYQWGN